MRTVLEADSSPCLERTGTQNYPQAHFIGSGKRGWVTRFSVADDLPSVPVFDRTLPVKQMHVLEALDLLILRADKGGTRPPSPKWWSLGGRKSKWPSVANTAGHRSDRIGQASWFSGCPVLWVPWRP